MPLPLLQKRIHTLGRKGDENNLATDYSGRLSCWFRAWHNLSFWSPSFSMIWTRPLTDGIAILCPVPTRQCFCDLDPIVHFVLEIVFGSADKSWAYQHPWMSAEPETRSQTLGLTSGPALCRLSQSQGLPRSPLAIIPTVAVAAEHSLCAGNGAQPFGWISSAGLTLRTPQEAGGLLLPRHRGGCWCPRARSS